MSDAPNKNQLRRKYPVFVRLIGILMLIGVATGNVLLFSQAYPVNLQWMIIAASGICVFGLSIWLIAKVSCLEFSLTQARALRLLLSVIVMLVFAVVFYKIINH
ncbi:MAG: hypothetical protein ABL902_05940 [Gallionella sp.]